MGLKEILKKQGGMKLLIGFLPLPTAITLVIQIVAGAVIYISASALLKIEEFEYLFGMVKSFLKK